MGTRQAVAAAAGVGSLLLQGDTHHAVAVVHRDQDSQQQPVVGSRLQVGTRQQPEGSLVMLGGILLAAAAVHRGLSSLWKQYQQGVELHMVVAVGLGIHLGIGRLVGLKDSHLPGAAAANRSGSRRHMRVSTESLSYQAGCICHAHVQAPASAAVDAAALHAASYMHPSTVRREDVPRG